MKAWVLSFLFAALFPTPRQSHKTSTMSPILQMRNTEAMKG